MTNDEREVIETAKDLVALWKSQRISGATRAERNAAIEGTRDKLIRAIDRLNGEPGGIRTHAGDLSPSD